MAPSERIMVLKSPFNIMKDSVKLLDFSVEKKQGTLEFMSEVKKPCELSIYVGVRVSETERQPSVGPLQYMANLG